MSETEEPAFVLRVSLRRLHDPGVPLQRALRRVYSGDWGTRRQTLRIAV